MEIREPLNDNLMLRRQLEIEDEYSQAPSQAAKPPLHAVQSITSWVCCIATYLAVLATEGWVTADHLAYVLLIVLDVVKYKRDGWRVYELIFRQNMAARAQGCHGLSWTLDCMSHPRP